MKENMEMKKTYISPVTNVTEIELENMITASGVTGNNGIGNGGVDEDGSLDPDAKEYDGYWD
jgi:hypothetical protein